MRPEHISHSQCSWARWLHFGRGTRLAVVAGLLVLGSSSARRSRPSHLASVTSGSSAERETTRNETSPEAVLLASDSLVDMPEAPQAPAMPGPGMGDTNLQIQSRQLPRDATRVRLLQRLAVLEHERDCLANKLAETVGSAQSFRSRVALLEQRIDRQDKARKLAAIGLVKKLDVPWVNSPTQLAELPASAVIGDWEYRLGLSESGEIGGPWILLLCHARFTGEGEAGIEEFEPVRGERVGPFACRLEAENDTRFQAVHRLVMRRPASKNPYREALYATSLTTFGDGRYELSIDWPGGAAMIRKTLAVEVDSESGWTLLAESAVDSATPSGLVFASERTSVIANIDGGLPIWARSGQDGSLPAFRKIPRLPGVLDSAGQPGQGVDGSLGLSLEDGCFRLVSKCRLAAGRSARKHLLGRWRKVEGDHPLESSRRGLREDREPEAKQQWQVDISAELPEWLGDLEKGDRVELQVMYAPDRYRLHRPERSVSSYVSLRERREGSPKAPLVSNPLVFTVTEDMLRHP